MSVRGIRLGDRQIGIVGNADCAQLHVGYGVVVHIAGRGDRDLECHVSCRVCDHQRPK